jgi:DNA topoisomerase IA
MTLDHFAMVFEARLLSNAETNINKSGLYERYKAITYPRTDSRYLPEDYLETPAIP